MNRVFSGAHQHGVLKDMGNAGGVFRYGLKGYTEGLVGIVILDSQGRGTEELVFKEIHGGADLGNILHPLQDKAVIGGADLIVSHFSVCEVFFMVCTAPGRANKGTIGGRSSVNISIAVLKLFMGIKEDGDRTGVDQADLHHGLEFSMGRCYAEAFDSSNKVPVEPIGFFRRCRH